MTNLTDQELVKLSLNGDLLAFEEIVNRYQQPLLRYTFRLLNNNWQDSEDAVSETFLKIYKYLNSYNDNWKFSSWLYRIAHNQAVNIIKSKSGLFFIDLDNFRFTSQSKEESNLQKEELENVLQKLKIEDRNLLILFYIEEMSLNQIGEILQLNPNTVAKKLSRARAKAKKIICLN
jgi:RNA polymerase sigma-70 factor, ECF subfamily